MKKVLFEKEGFTLIELMTVMAIIGILAAAIMVSLGAQKKRAEGGKILMEFSGVMQKIYLCIADDGIINVPNITGEGNNDICSLSSNYGQWPDLSEFDNFSYSSTDPFVSPWYYSAISISDDMVICCNSRSEKCQKLDDTTTCNANTVLR